MPSASSVFFGGGTPSMVPAAGSMQVLAAVPLAGGAEVTVECNPDTVTAELLAAYRAGGVNRLSIGVQSMVPHVLAALGRTHDPANVRRAVALTRAAGFDVVQPRPHLRRRRRVPRRLAPHARARPGPRSAARERLWPDGRGRHASGRRPGAAPRRRQPGGQVRAGRRHAGRSRARELRDLELGPAGPRVPAQPPLLEPGRLPRLRVRRPQSPGRAALVERPHPGAVSRSCEPRPAG